MVKISLKCSETKLLKNNGNKYNDNKLLVY